MPSDKPNRRFGMGSGIILKSASTLVGHRVCGDFNIALHAFLLTSLSI